MRSEDEAELCRSPSCPHLSARGVDLILFDENANATAKRWVSLDELGATEDEEAGAEWAAEERRPTHERLGSLDLPSVQEEEEPPPRAPMSAIQLREFDLPAVAVNVLVRRASHDQQFVPSKVPGEEAGRLRRKGALSHMGRSARCQSTIEFVKEASESGSEDEGNPLERSLSHSTPSVDSVGLPPPAQPKPKEAEKKAEKKAKKAKSSKSNSQLPAWSMMSARQMSRPMPPPGPKVAKRTASSVADIGKERQLMGRSKSGFFNAFHSIRKPAVKKVANGGGRSHVWVGASVSTPSARCELCDKSLSKSSSLQCSHCDVFVHDACKSQLGSCAKLAAKHPHQSVSPLRGRSLVPELSVQQISQSTQGNDEGEEGSRLPPSTSLPDFAASPTTHLSLRPTRRFPNLQDDERWADLTLFAKESEAWSLDYRSLAKTLPSKEVKRQDVMYELFRTEKHHCQILVILQKVYRETFLPGEGGMSPSAADALVPSATLGALLRFHLGLFRGLRERRNQAPQVPSIADILCAHFTPEASAEAVEAYVSFCAGKAAANALYRRLLLEKEDFRTAMMELLRHPGYKEKSLPDCLLLVTQRLTKYPILLDSVLKNSAAGAEAEGAREARDAVAAFAARVDAGVQRVQLKEEWAFIAAALDPASTTPFLKGRYGVDELLKETRLPRFIGDVELRKADGKMTDVKLVLFDDILVILQRVGLKWTFSPQDKKAAVIPMKNVIIRDKAGTGNQGIFLIVTSKEMPELYEVQAARKSLRKELVSLLAETAKSAPVLTAPRKATDHLQPTTEPDEEELMGKLWEHLGRKAEAEAAAVDAEASRLSDYVEGALGWYERLRALLGPLTKAATPSNRRVIAKNESACEGNLDTSSFYRHKRRVSASLRRTHSSISTSAAHLLTRAVTLKSRSFALLPQMRTEPD